MTTPRISPSNVHFLRTPVALALAASLSGCLHYSTPILPDREKERTATPSTEGSAETKAKPGPEKAIAAADPASASMPEANKEAVATKQEPVPTPLVDKRLFQTPSAPTAERSATRQVPAVDGTEGEGQLSAVALEQLPLPVFIDTVYASILKRNVSVDPSIATRKDLVSLKSGKPLSATALAEAAKATLKSYGLAVTEFNGLVRITPAGGASGYLPELMRGRALPDVPASLRPIFFLVELQSVSPAQVSNWLRTLFNNRVSIQDDLPRQALLLSGQSDDIAAALEAIEVLDQPVMRGRISARVAPLFWSADELAKRLSEVMQAQGYNVGTTPNAQAPVILLPIGPLNSVIVFASSEQVLNHALRWATELDQPASGRGTAGYFTYQVRNMDAADLAKTLQDVMNPAGTGGGTTNGVRSRVVVNAASNTLIIQGNPTEYQQWFGLLQELDKPARTALISITVAEVSLDNQEGLGFDWMLKQFSLGGISISGLTSKVGAQASSTLTATIANQSGSVTALLGAMASANKAKILANPSVMARNGEQATIQVGQDVPIITQQQQQVGSSSGVPGGNQQQNILNTVQYRNTGVILRVKPVIHAGGRIDIDVEQEVSQAVANTVGGTTSPVIKNRRIATKLSVADGTTVLMGGLMREDSSSGDSGVPVIKDIPLMGHLFKQSNVQRTRTELVMLITPYVISDEFEAQAISQAFRHQFSWDASQPIHQLRPPKVEGAPTAPVDAKLAREANQAKPYVLPPQEEKMIPQAESGKKVVPTQQIPRDLPLSPQNGNSPKRKEQIPATPAGLPQTSGPKPVEDPQLLKELMEAGEKKR